MRTVVCIAIIKNKKILLVRKNKTWILPGGKLEKNETSIECLFREIREELPGLTISQVEYYGFFDGIAPHTRDWICSQVYLSRKSSGLIKPDAEIIEARWAKYPEKHNISDIVSKVTTSLRLKGYL